MPGDAAICLIVCLLAALLQMFEEPNLPDDPVLYDMKMRIMLLNLTSVITSVVVFRYFRKIITTEDFDPETEELSRLTEMVESLKIEIADLSEENERLRATVRMFLEIGSPTTIPDYSQWRLTYVK